MGGYIQPPSNKAETPPIAMPPTVSADLSELDQLHLHAESQAYAPSPLLEDNCVKYLTATPDQNQVASFEKHELPCLAVSRLAVAAPPRKNFQYAISYLPRPTAMRTERCALAVGCQHFASSNAQCTAHLTNNPGPLRKSAARSSVKRRIPRKMAPERAVRARTDRQ